LLMTWDIASPTWKGSLKILINCL